MSDPNAPVLDWPLATGERGREVWYGLVGPRDGSRAFWYRYTLLSTAGGRREGRVWAALTDGENSRFVSRSFPLGVVHRRDDPFALEVGDADTGGELTSSSAWGALPEEGVSWDLEHDPDEYVFTPLRSQTLTALLGALVDAGSHWSRNESVLTSGTVTVGDHTVAFDEAPGHQGHTVGTYPPERWRWVQCNGFEDPALSLEALDLDGTLSVLFRRGDEVYPLNRLVHVLRNNRTLRDDVGHWRFRASGEGVELTATVRADPAHWQPVAYCAPDETLRYNAHCSVSDVTLTYEVADEGPVTVESPAGRAEWVGSEPPISGEYRPAWD
ncbi:tocopherol cyclase family protein [Salinirubellus salinus]|uniref:Tocopherol cyclase family protein n=1 Tax=Salinirubellus salinus TaxID=1364945 RepID=A0A9E7R4B2_9EURY|nr:tocopherol cyclase family protein [Salinirubellus salinus]UWM55362.1 tocopherol cyclase family protein [Salinirubellus salinus]